jgi:hyperosmotically inducible protein
MKTLQLLSVALALVLAGCNRDVAEREARETADELRTAAATAGERLADSWLTTKVQAQYFADDDIKARHIDVTTRDGVVTLRGQVESDRVRELATQIARNTDGVRQVQDQLAVGQPGTASPAPAPSAPVATTGSAPDAVLSSDAAAASGVTDDERIVTDIQAKYFLDANVKSRDIDVESRNGVVTVSGRVGSDSERAQALILARMTGGVHRVEDGLTVDASLAPPEAIGTAGTALEQGAATDAPNADSSLETSIRQQLSSDKRLAGAQVEVSAKDGVVLVQGTVPDQGSKQHVLTIVRQADGVAQVVDRLTVRTRR